MELQVFCFSLMSQGSLNNVGAGRFSAVKGTRWLFFGSWLLHKIRLGICTGMLWAEEIEYGGLETKSIRGFLYDLVPARWSRREEDVGIRGNVYSNGLCRGTVKIA